VKTNVYPAVLLTVVPLLAACSSSSTTPALQSTQQASSASVHADTRFGLSRSQLSAVLANRGPGDASAAKKQPTVFVSDLDTQAIELYPEGKKNPTQIGTITSGINEPINDAVDSSGTLYVANNGNSTVTEYPLGASTPSVTLSDTLQFPNGVAVDSAGNVYVTSGATAGSCYVVVFPKGSSTPSKQINGFDLPIGLAVDAKGDLFVADALKNDVYEVAKGKSTPKELGLTGLEDPTGVSIDPKGNLWVVSYSGDTASEFVVGKTKPAKVVTDSLSGPYSIAFGKGGQMYVGNSHNFPGDVTAFKKNATAPYTTFQVQNPAGMAVYPPPK
jgi:serine/threonine-protein kinase